MISKIRLLAFSDCLTVTKEMCYREDLSLRYFGVSCSLCHWFSMYLNITLSGSDYSKERGKEYQIVR